MNLQNVIDQRREAHNAIARYELAVALAFHRDGARLLDLAEALDISVEGVRKIIQRAGYETQRGRTSARQRAAITDRGMGQMSRHAIRTATAAGLLSIALYGCANAPDDDDLPGQAPTSVRACDPDTETCE